MGGPLARSWARSRGRPLSGAWEEGTGEVVSGPTGLGLSSRPVLALRGAWSSD